MALWFMRAKHGEKGLLKSTYQFRKQCDETFSDILRYLILWNPFTGNTWLTGVRHAPTCGQKLENRLWRRVMRVPSTVSDARNTLIKLKSVPVPRHYSFPIYHERKSMSLGVINACTLAGEFYYQESVFRLDSSRCLSRFR